MARPRSFDPDDVLEVAREVFLRKGYQAASLDEITAASGIAKPSLYAAFGDKSALFLRVLDRYHDGILGWAERVLAQPGPARDAIRQWLTGFVPYCSGAKGARGCLSINSATDRAGMSGWTASISGPFARRVTGMKSASGSYPVRA